MPRGKSETPSTHAPETPAQAQAASGAANLTFEQAMAELEKIVEEMERRDIPLDETIARYERGVLLSARCKQCLDEAEAKILKLTGDGKVAPLEKDKAAKEEDPF